MSTPVAMSTDELSHGASGWALRKAAEERRNRTVSDAQLQLFARWGLLERRADGYAPGSEERLCWILDEELTARSLPRRVVRLRADFNRFPVPAAPLRQAFIELAPTIRRPVAKLRLIERAWTAMADRASGRRGTPKRRRGRLPAATTWSPLLTAVPAQRYEVWATGWYRLARDVLPLYGREIGVDLEAIPIEERVVMVAVLDLTGSHPTTAIQP